MGAEIRIDQPTGAGAGVAGQARTGIRVGVQVELHDVGSGSPSSRQWSFVDRPTGSSATLGGATTALATFTPDVPGRYLVWIARDDELREPHQNGMVRVVEASLTEDGDAIPDYYALPAAGERDHHSDGIPGQGSSGRGWTALLESFRDALQNRLNVVSKDSGDTLSSGALNLLQDDGDATPSFVLPAPATWTGRRLVAKRLSQTAVSAVLTVAGGATIDGGPSHELIGNVAAELWSDGTSVYVGPTTSVARASWQPQDLATSDGGFFWAKGIRDPSLRTMSGSTILELRNGFTHNEFKLEDVGTPTINTSFPVNGHPRLITGSTHELLSAYGGPTGNEEHWMIALVDGRDAATIHGTIMRCGAKGTGNCSALGSLTNPLYAAGDTADFVPWAASPSPAPVAGELRVIMVQHLPQFGQRLMRIDGYVPQVSNHHAAKTLTMDGSFGFGRSITAGQASAMGTLDAFWGRGSISAQSIAKIIEYWRQTFGFARLDPNLWAFGDSMTYGYESGGATSWVAKTRTLVNSILTSAGRPNMTLNNTAASAKLTDGAWDALNPPMTYHCGAQPYGSFLNSGTRMMAASARYSRSGRRLYEVAIGMGGTNDIINQGVSGATIVERLKRCWGPLTDQGYLTVGVACPSGDTTTFWTAPRRAAREYARDWITTQAVSEGYLRVGLSPDSVLTLPPSTSSHTHFMDGLHLNDAGEAALAAYVAPFVAQLINDHYPSIAA